MKKPETYSSPLLEKVFSGISEADIEKTRVKMRIAVRIDDAMREKGIGRKQLADMLGVQPSMVTRWLSGSQNFTVDTLVEISLALSIDLFDYQYQSPQPTGATIGVDTTNQGIAAGSSTATEIIKRKELVRKGSKFPKSKAS